MEGAADERIVQFCEMLEGLKRQSMSLIIEYVDRSLCVHARIHASTECVCACVCTTVYVFLCVCLYVL
jgi:hypothetical protein